MDYVWEMIQPYVAAILAALGSGGIITLIVRAIVNKILRKNNAMLDATYNTDRVSQLVAEKLAGKTLNIDVTAVTERSLKKIDDKIGARVEKVENATNSLALILVAIAKANIKLKALTDDERAELANAIAELEKGYKPPEKSEAITVRLTPIALNDDPTNDEPNEESDSDGGVNFGGLDTK